jgi:hypothetical protein
MGRSLTTRDESIRALGGNLLIAGIVAVLAAFGLGWVLAGASLRPIHRLTQTAQTITVESKVGVGTVFAVTLPRAR